MNEIGVVVLNYMKYELTKQCVDALLALQASIQIVVVDNNSPNESYKKLSQYFEAPTSVEVVKNKENSGYAAGNNVGIRYLFKHYDNIRFVCIMNPDVQVTYKELFENLKNKLEDNDDIAIMTGVMRGVDNRPVATTYWNVPKKREIALGHSVLWKKEYPINTNLPASLIRVEVVPGSFFMVKRVVYEQLGGLDEGTFLYNEENILGYQIRNLGMTEALSLDDYYIHNHPKGPREALKIKLSSRKVGNQSRRYLCHKYYGKLDAALLEGVIAANYIIITCLHIGGSLYRIIRREK